eukprot:TRINITY_DN400_c0_g3_i1.p1 TRINITY_DN400_c0_g3~~TRINITY_DN400_c0_g3_i1.p1  ORF type:complete len:617 (+),score=83.45 TRINITY_DN400_c0_g3_i1:66-1853(+)
MSFTALTPAAKTPLGKRKVNELVTEPSKRHQPSFDSMWRNSCMDVTKEDGWMSLYTVPAKGTRSIQEFEELTLRRIEMLTVLHQEEGLERLSYMDILKEITAASKGEKATHCKGVFEWVSPVTLESTLMTAEFGIRYEKRVSYDEIKTAKRTNTSGLYSANDDDEGFQAYERAWRGEKVSTITDLFNSAYEDDSIAHWACRLAFCGEEKWRNWFLKYEETLFKGRVMGLSVSDQQTLLKRHTGLTETLWTSLSEEQIETLALMETKFDRTARKQTAAEVLRSKNRRYYLVDFTSVPSLVKDRKVVVFKGKAFITHEQAMAKLVEAFRESVTKGLQDALRARPDIAEREKDRVSAFLNKAVLESMNVVDRSRAKQGPEAVLDIEDIGDHSAMHFPLCMRSMDKHLRATRNLKYEGRFQYGVFLKQAGLSLDQAMKFFSQTMTLRVTTAKFPKSEYGYGVRSLYGREGKKTDYTAHSCHTLIVSKAPGPGACHGCPFRHTHESKLRPMLMEPRSFPTVKGKEKIVQLNSTIQLKEAQVQDVMKKVSTGHISAACRSYFNATHPGHPENHSFSNPLAYYQSSLEYAKERAEEQTKSNA